MAILLSEAIGFVLITIIIYKILDRIIRIPSIGECGSRYILVTGCDTGFGFEISKRLDKLGCHVFSACLTEKGQENLKKKCSDRLTAFQMNVAKHDSVVKGFEFVSGKLPEGKGLWGILNNAGVPGLVGPAEWLTIDNYQEVLDVNLLGLIDVSTTFLPLVKKEKGRVVNTTSMLGRTTLMGSTPYGVSKYGAETFSDSFRRQLKPFNVSVHMIEPGFFATNMSNPERVERTLRQSWDQCSPELKQEYGKEYLEKSVETIIKSMVKGIISEDIDIVLDAYEHALLGKFPRARYLLGWDARLVLVPIQSLPEWLGDWLHDLLAPGRPLPDACK